MPEPRIATKAMIEQMFDNVATSYDQTGPSIFTQFGARLVEHMPLTSGASILDVATGTGAVLLPAARLLAPAGRVTGVDLSMTILEEAERAVHRSGLTNVELRKMDAEHLDFADHSFDIVSCAFAFFLFPDKEAALSEMYRVCKPGGYIVVSTFDKTPPPFNPALPRFAQQAKDYRVTVPMPHQANNSPEEIEALLNRFGFRSIETYSETNDITYARVEDWWEFLMTVGPRLTILGMDEKMRTRFKDEYLSKLRPMLVKDGLHLSVGVVYAIAQC